MLTAILFALAAIFAILALCGIRPDKMAAAGVLSLAAAGIVGSELL